MPQKSRGFCLTIGLLFVICASDTTRSAFADSAEELTGLIAAARGQYVPATAEDLAAAREDLQSALDKLDRKLARWPESGPPWRAYLGWPQIEEQLAAGAAADPAQLAALAARFTRGHRGLELPVFAEVGLRLEVLRSVLLAYQDAAAAAQTYEQQLDQIASLVGVAATDWTREQAAALGAALAWLEERGQAEGLVEALRDTYSTSNLRVRAHADLLRQALGREVDSTEPVRDVILGTQIYGTGRTLGQVDVELVPCSDRAMFDLVFEANNDSRSKGYNGPVVIWSLGDTDLHARQRLAIDESGLSAGEPATDAQTDTTITGIGTHRRGLLGRLIRRIAARKAAQQQSLAEAIAADHAAQRLAERYGDESASLIARANRQYREKVVFPLRRWGAYPRLWRTRTSDAVLSASLLHDEGARLAATLPAPEWEADPWLGVRLHESFVNNFAFDLLAGRTLTKERTEELAIQILGEVPEELRRDPDDEEAGDEEDEEDSPEEKDWSITFDAAAPLSLQIDADFLVLTIRGERYTSGQKKYEAMNVTARYQLQVTDGRLIATRAGDLEILPPNFDPERDRFGVRQTVLRNLLRRRFGKLLKPEIVIEHLQFEGDLARIGRLGVAQATTGQGWLALGWNPVAGPAAEEMPLIPAAAP